jgi:lipopolysaccharide/colanic/teichoic acid biosynthesis glycosyltransferase
MNSKRIHSLILAADLVWMLLAFLASFYLRYSGHLGYSFSRPLREGLLLLLGLSLGTWSLLYIIMELDCFRSGWQASAMITKTSLAAVLLMLTVTGWGYLTQLHYSRLALFYFGVLFWSGVIAIRGATRAFLHARVRAGKMRRVVLIGDNGLSEEIVYRIRRHPELLYEVVGFLSPSGNGVVSNGSRTAALDELGSLEAVELLKKMEVQELIVLPKYAPGLELQNFLVRCQEEGFHIMVLPQPYELYVSRPKLIELDGLPLVLLERPSFSKVAHATKRIFDVAIGLVLLVPAFIIMTLAGAVLLMKERRFLRKETRCGRQGQPFAMYRLDIDIDEATASRYHKVLRRLSISELPQLLNVLQGQMSLVGPRPESPEQVRDYSEWQRERLKVKPGITGLAQVNGLREHHPSTDKTRHDLEYILHWTPILDFLLLFQTIWTLASRLTKRQELSDPASSSNSLPDQCEFPQPLVSAIKE